MLVQYDYGNIMCENIKVFRQVRVLIDLMIN
jgi:hypothetical protein